MKDSNNGGMTVTHMGLVADFGENMAAWTLVPEVP